MKLSANRWSKAEGAPPFQEKIPRCWTDRFVVDARTKSRLQWRWLRENRPREERKWSQQILSCRKWKKSEGSSKLKEGRCVTEACWCIEWTSYMSNPFFFFFFAIFSLAVHFFCFQNKVAHGERSIFAYEYMVGLQRCGGYTDDFDVQLTEMCPAHHGQTGNTAQEW